MPVARFTGDIEVDKNLLVKGKAESKGIFTAPDAILGGKSTVKHTHDEHGDGGGTTGPMK